MMEPFAWFFLGLAGVGWVAGWVMSARFRAVPGLEPGAPKPGARISVIVPARNEEENLSRLLSSLEDQEFRPREIIVVDDQSDDRTAAIARESGARVVEGQPLPDGWYGKPWACLQGAAVASGDWLLFLDADVVVEREGLFRIGRLARDEGVVHSFCPHHRVPTAREQLSAFFNVIMILGMNAFTLRGGRAKSIGLFGQAMLVSRAQYEAVGGHEPVRNEVLENFHLSRHFADAGCRCRCWLGKGTLRMRMFPGSFGELVRGWSKGFVSGAGNTPLAALAGISLWLSGLLMSLVSLSFLPLVPGSVDCAVLALYAACAIQCLYLFRHAGTFWPAGALVFPVGLVFYQVLFFGSLLRKRGGGKVLWKGRDVA